MTLEEYKAIILATTHEDWTFISCGGGSSGPSFRDALSTMTWSDSRYSSVEIASHHRTLSLKSDLLVSVSHGIKHNDNFREGWANSFPDEHASSSFVDFFYANQLVHRDIYVSVDGARCLIPLPSIELEMNGEVKSLTLSRDKYEFFRILNQVDDDYTNYVVHRAGIEIVDTPWMV